MDLCFVSMLEALVMCFKSSKVIGDSSRFQGFTCSEGNLADCLVSY